MGLSENQKHAYDGKEEEEDAFETYSLVVYWWISLTSLVALKMVTKQVDHTNAFSSDWRWYVYRNTNAIWAGLE